MWVVVTSSCVTFLSCLCITACERYTLTAITQLVSWATHLVAYTLTCTRVQLVGWGALPVTSTATLFVIEYKVSGTVGTLVTFTSALVSIKLLISRARLRERALAGTCIITKCPSCSTVLNPGTLTFARVLVKNFVRWAIPLFPA